MSLYERQWSFCRLAGVFESLGRSHELACGIGWQVFGVLVAYIIVAESSLCHETSKPLASVSLPPPWVDLWTEIGSNEACVGHLAGVEPPS